MGEKQVNESTAVDLLNRSFLDHETYNIAVDEILKTSGREGLSKVAYCHMHRNTCIHNLYIFK